MIHHLRWNPWLSMNIFFKNNKEISARQSLFFKENAKTPALTTVLVKCIDVV